MGLVSLLVLASGAAMLLALLPGQDNTRAAQSSSMNPALAPNADVQRLLFIINEKKTKSSLNGVKNINFKINKLGQATNIVIVAKPGASGKNIEQRIRRAAFAPQNGSLKERRIHLLFKG